jgi:redox-sensitive bicupin YhaK (pirin superfamily)
MNLVTAGRGIAHSERSPLTARQDSEGLFGIQSWIALPQAQEETDPSFQHFDAASLSFRGAAGPIVMNTDAELEQAYAELRNGTFIKQRDQWDGTLRRSREDERSNEPRGNKKTKTGC